MESAGRGFGAESSRREDCGERYEADEVSSRKLKGYRIACEQAKVIGERFSCVSQFLWKRIKSLGWTFLSIFRIGPEEIEVL